MASDYNSPTNRNEENSGKHIITKYQCIEALIEKYSNRKNCFLALAIIISFILILVQLTGASSFDRAELLITLVFCVAFYVCGFFNLFKYNKIKKLNFYIRTENCINKYSKPDRGLIPGGEYLVFSDGTKYKADRLANTVKLAQNEYGRACIGKKYYLICSGNDNILLVLPCDEYEFESDGFEKKGGVLYPLKGTVRKQTQEQRQAPSAENYSVKESDNKSTEKYDLKDIKNEFHQKSSEQYLSYSEEDRSKVDNYNKLTKEAKTMHIIISVISGVNLIYGSFISAMACVSKISSVVALLYQTVLFVFMCYYFCKIMRAKRLALDAIPSDYTEKYFITKKHNKSVLFVFVLVLDFFVYVFWLILLIGALIGAFVR